MGKLNEKVSYWRGEHSTIPKDITPGRILFEEDTGDVFLDYRDYSTGELVRVQLTDSTKFDVSGGTFTGPVILYRDPEEEMEATPKRYVDNLKGNIDDHSNDKSIHVTQEDKDKWNNAVQSEAGKSLTSNDFTDALKDKLDGISENATKVSYESEFDPDEDTVDAFVKLGTVYVDDVPYIVYCPVPDSADKLSEKRSIDGILFDGSNNVSRIGRCYTDADDIDKTVDIENFEPIDGALAIVFIANGNTAEEPQLNISETGSYALRVQDDPAYIPDPGYYTVMFVDDGDPRYEIVSRIPYNIATEDRSGLMSAEDKEKLDSMESLQPATDEKLGGLKVGKGLSFYSDGTVFIDADSLSDALGIDITDLGSSVFEGAVGDVIEEDGSYTEGSDGKSGLVPAPTKYDADYFLRGDGVWAPITDVEAITNEEIMEMLKELKLDKESFNGQTLMTEMEADTMFKSIFGS